MLTFHKIGATAAGQRCSLLVNSLELPHQNQSKTCAVVQVWEGTSMCVFEPGCSFEAWPSLAEVFVSLLFLVKVERTCFVCLDKLVNKFGHVCQLGFVHTVGGFSIFAYKTQKT